MYGTAAIAAISAFQAAQVEHKSFMASLDGLPEEERQRRIESRAERIDEERRSREMLRASEPRDNTNELLAAGVLGVIFGLAIS